MSIKLGIVMDPINAINIYKDSSFAMLLAAQAREWPLFYMELQDLLLRDGESCASVCSLTVRDDPRDWFTLGPRLHLPLRDLDVILMRKDPPFNMEYIYATHILERAEHAGVLVVNRPQSLRDVNEKLYTSWFPQCCVPTLVSRSEDQLRQFIAEQGDTVLKPLDRMGGALVFRVRGDDPNLSVILEAMTEWGERFTLAQRYISEIQAGDKRILLIDGKPVPYALARIPPAGETRGNLAAGGRGVGTELSARDRWICQQVGEALSKKGLVLVGLDVIGDYLTEINVTSPTCIRELDKIFGLNIAAELMDAIARRLEGQQIKAPASA